MLKERSNQSESWKIRLYKLKTMQTVSDGIIEYFD